MRSALPLLWLCALPALPACSDTLAGGSCLTARDCPLGQICVGNACEALEGGNSTRCTANDDCGIGEFCDATGACTKLQIVNCTDDSACPPHQRCQMSTNACVDGARSCADSTQCQQIGQHCDPLRRQCVQCLNTTHCPTGWNCDNGACVDPNGSTMCSGDSECRPPFTVCATDTCVPGCGQPGGQSCGNGFICDSGTGRCREGMVQCQGDAQCGPPASICESMQCIGGCGQPGGLQCTGGNVCNAMTGRCEQNNACSQDNQCNPPQMICENSQCTLGCAQPGGITCSVGTVCDTATGRCVRVAGPCMADGDCGPPAMVCDNMQCIGGCTEVGGLQCNGNTTCNATTGRCDPGQNPLCTSDAQCAPPSTICDTISGNCIAGCQTSGCAANETCNPTTGRCAMTQTPPGGTNLDATCTLNTDCDSRVCFDLGQGFGNRCVQSCGAASDCPMGFTCYDFNGAKMCLSTSVFTGATFNTPAGGQCANGGQCQSNFCPAGGGGRVCVDTCTESNECNGGQCRWYEVTPDRFIAACNGPQGNLQDGASCTTDVQCRSGSCLNNACAKLCSSTNSCSAGETCVVANYSICVAEVIGLCLAFQPNFVKGCVAGPHGNDPVGASCTGFSNCRSGLCHTGISQCTDVCSTDADCPGTHKCNVLDYGALSDGTPVFINVCMPQAWNG